ncbi:hypothetical protein QUF72_19490 [Desulfobacterales bacterium HSG2]|nr:hypothetical protein [Desulfobacterales bacterium HSG2]
MSSMQLENIFSNSVYFERNNHFDVTDDDSAKFSYDIGIDGEFYEDSEIMVVNVIAKTPSKKDAPDHPFHFKVVVTGVFKFDSAVDSKSIRQFQSERIHRDR